MNVRINYKLDFTAGIYFNNALSMNNYTLRVWMITNATDAASQNIAFARLKYFIYSELDSTIFINKDDADQCTALVNAGLKITTMPGEPVDQLVGIMLYYKLNAIMEGRISVVETELSSELGEGLVYLHSEHENPDINNYPDWWTGTDPLHCDTQLMINDKIVAIHHTNAWRELDLGWPDHGSSEPDDNTVVFADFKQDDSK